MKSCIRYALSFLLVALLALAGCGGSGASTPSDSDAAAAGVWSATLTRTTDQVDLALKVEAGVVTGTCGLNRDGSAFVGVVTGTYSHFHMTLDVNFGSGFTWHMVLVRSGDTFTATITENGTTTFTMTFMRGGNDTPAVAGNYTGSWSSGGTGGEGVMTGTLAQDGNSVTGSYSAPSLQSLVGGKIKGVVIGNNFVAQIFLDDNTTLAGSFVGSFESGTLTGAYKINTAGNIDHGAFNMHL